MPDGYETIDQAARRLQVHRRTIQRWIAEGRLMAYHLAGEPRTLIRSNGVDRLAKPKPRRADQRPARRTERVSSTSTG